MSKKQKLDTPAATDERWMMLRRTRDDVYVYWSLLGWSEIYAMKLPETVARTHAERLETDFGEIDVLPYAPIPMKSIKPKDYAYVR